MVILSDNKISTLSKFNVFADNNLSVVQMVQPFYNRLEDNVGNGKCWTCGFSPFPMMSLTSFFPRVFKSLHCMVMHETKAHRKKSENGS